MSRFLHRYAVDPSGISLSNLVQNEVRTVPHRNRRAIVPKYGAFYAKSMVVRDTTTNVILTLGTHYVFSRLYDEASELFGQEIYGLVILIDSQVSDTVVLDYQVVGGKYEDSLPVILELINAVRNDTRPVQYSSIDNPLTSFYPVRHMHDIGDMFGFEPLVHAVERARMMVELSSQIDYDNYYKHIDVLLTSLANLGSMLAGEVLANHIGDPSSHSQYVLRSKVDSYAIIVQKPNVVAPVNNATNVSRAPNFVLSNYACMYRNLQKATQIQVSQTADFSGTLAIDVTLTGPYSNYQYPGTLQANTAHYWRGRYQADDLSWSDWSDTMYFATGAI